MDDQRPVRMSDQLSRFVDGHQVRTNPFGQNTIGERAYRRAERIVAAIHLLTNHVPREEPVRNMVRKESLRLLGSLLELRDEMRATSSSRAKAIYAQLRELISQVRMLAVSGFISTQNGDVVAEALDEVGAFLRSSERTTLAEPITLMKEDFASIRNTPVSSKASILDIKDSVMRDSTLIKDTASRNVKPNESRGRRAEAVLEVLRSHGTLAIKEIAMNLPEYSEKMVQRELASLVRSKRVAKSGHKRWSRYSAVS